MTEATRAQLYAAAKSIAYPGGPNFNGAVSVIQAYFASLAAAPVGDGPMNALAEILRSCHGCWADEARLQAYAEVVRQALHEFIEASEVWTPRRLRHLAEMAAAAMHARSKPLTSVEIDVMIDQALQVEFSTTGREVGA